MSAQSVGNVNLTLFGERSNRNANVQNVEYVPDLCANLLSVRQMTKNGKKLVFEGDECLIYDEDRQLMATAIVENELYKLQCEIKKDKALIAKGNFELWHRRMGHVCNKSLQDISKYVEISAPSENKKCITCTKAKQTRNVNKSSGTRESKLLELVRVMFLVRCKASRFVALNIY